MDGPIDVNSLEHTQKLVYSCKHYKDLTTARTKINSIVSKIQGIIDSLSSASGVDVEKVKEDLLKVKKSFILLNTSINERQASLMNRAQAYDEICKKYEDLCERHEKFSQSSMSYNKKQTRVLFAVRTTDVYVTDIYNYDSFEWRDDGFMCVWLVKTRISQKRVNQNIVNDTMINDGDPSVSKTKEFRLVLLNGELSEAQSIITN